MAGGSRSASRRRRRRGGPSRGRARSARGRRRHGRPRRPWPPRRAACGRRRRREPARRARGPGCRAGRRRCCRCGSGRRSPSGRRGPGTRTTIGLRNWPELKNWSEAASPRSLVERVVDVGQVLDLRDRQQADVRRALGDAEDARLVEEGVEDPRRPEPFLEAVRDVVDPTLAADVLAEHEELGPAQQLVGECGVQAAGKGPRRRRGGGLREGSRRRTRCVPRPSPRDRRSGARGRGRGGTAPSGAVTSSVVCRRGRRAASSATAMTRSRVSRTRSRSSSGLAAPSSISRRALRRSGSRASTGFDLRDGRGRSARRRCRHGPTAARCAGGGRQAVDASRTWSTASPTASHTSSMLAIGLRHSAGAAGCRRSPRSSRRASGTLMPVPLSSHTRSSGIGRPIRTA